MVRLGSKDRRSFGGSTNIGGADATDHDGWTGSGGVACVHSKESSRLLDSCEMVMMGKSLTIGWGAKPGGGCTVGSGD